MKLKFLNFWELLRESFWFIPSLMAFAAVVAAMAMVRLDERIDLRTLPLAWMVYSGGAEGARAVLSAVATSIMTVTGVTFTITIAALSLASQQFGPRLIGNFTRDRGNQAVLGIFIATFLYCLLVLRTVHSFRQNDFVPHLAVTLGVVLTLISIGVLIYFIHHIADSIHVSTIVRQVGEELEHAIDRLYPALVGHGAGDLDRAGSEEGLPNDFERRSAPLPSEANGYIRSIDADRLIEIAGERDLVLRLRHHPGDFVIRGSILADAWPGDRVDETLVEQVNALFTLGAQRTLTQDVEYAVHQLAEVAVRALSPGVNDPFTAMSCVDWLGAALSRFAGREMPSPCRYDSRGRLRVVTRSITFDQMIDAAFHQIRQYGRGSVSVTLRLLETLTAITPCVCRPDDRAALLRHARLIREDSLDAIHVRSDRMKIEETFHGVLKALDEPDAESGP